MTKLIEPQYLPLTYSEATMLYIALESYVASLAKRCEIQRKYSDPLHDYNELYEKIEAFESTFHSHQLLYNKGEMKNTLVIDKDSSRADLESILNETVEVWKDTTKRVNIGVFIGLINLQALFKNEQQFYIIQRDGIRTLYFRDDVQLLYYEDARASDEKDSVHRGKTPEEILNDVIKYLEPFIS